MKTLFNFLIDKRLLGKLKEYAKQQGMSIAEIIRTALLEFFAREKK